MRQERVPETDRTCDIHGSHRIVRPREIGHHWNSHAYLDSDVEHGERRIVRELVSAESSTSIKEWIYIYKKDLPVCNDFNVYLKGSIFECVNIKNN